MGILNILVQFMYTTGLYEMNDMNPNMYAHFYL